MGLSLYDTMSRERRPFVPLVEGEARLYTCGPTVHDYAHIGNLRTFLFEDLLRRVLKARGYRVIQVMNLTDVDDKIIAKAKAAGVSIDEYTAEYIDKFFEDLDALRIERAEHYPTATGQIDAMVELVRRLEEAGLTYRTEDGTIWFRIGAYEEYGKLSRVDLSATREGERVASDEYDKESPRDFALWKAAKPGEERWDTPIGEGRPGWHLECSSMAMEFLGETIDIHAGGVDLMFPHNENEIAQSEAATGETFSRTWLHAEHLIVEGEKMAKSLGNFFTLRDLLERGYRARAIRYLLLSIHYRQQQNFTFEALDQAAAALERLGDFVDRVERLPEGDEPDTGLAERTHEAAVAFDAALDDDLNTSRALGVVFEWVRDVNRAIDEERATSADRPVLEAFLGAFDAIYDVLEPETDEVGVPEEVDALIAEREEARESRDWERADAIRDELLERGYVIEDTAEGPRAKPSSRG